MEARIYEVTITVTASLPEPIVETRLVKAKSQAQARAFGRKKIGVTVDAKIPSQEALIQWAKGGMEVEDATKEPESAADLL